MAHTRYLLGLKIASIPADDSIQHTLLHPLTSSWPWLLRLTAALGLTGQVAHQREVAAGR